jgi:hypothetical protein
MVWGFLRLFGFFSTQRIYFSIFRMLLSINCGSFQPAALAKQGTHNRQQRRTMQPRRFEEKA